MAVQLPKSLEHEQGSEGAWSSGGIIQTLETTPELKWPSSVTIYDMMRRTDSEVAAVLRATCLPIRRTGWRIHRGDDVAQPVADFVATELGLMEPQDGRRRKWGVGISWDPFLRHSLLDLVFGHMFFEPLYQIGPPLPGQDGLESGRKYAHLVKLGPRLPRTINGFDVNDDGTLQAIHQLVVRNKLQQEVTIQATGPTGLPNLVPFVNEQEGSDWTGQSIFRSAYKHWLLKEMGERLGMQIIERNGMGLPSVSFPEGGDQALAQGLATSARAGETSGMALPAGYMFELHGVSGTLVDPLPQIKYHQQAIGRSGLAMFLDLGQDRGARSLAETFVDFFTIAVNAVIAAREEIITELIIRPLVTLNFGPDEPYPEVAADEITPQSPLTADAIAQLVTAGVIQPDEVLEGDVRRKFGLPPADPSTRIEPPDVGGPAPGEEDDTIDVTGGGGSGGSPAGGPGGGAPARMSGRQSVRQFTARLTDARRKVNEARALIRGR